MNLYLRFFSLLVKRLLQQRPMNAFDACATPFRVNLLDIDLNLHMNNGRYLSIMDLGRIDLMIRAGVFWKLARQGYYPVVASESIRFRQSLEPFQRFTLITQIESWDDKDFLMSQKFMRKDQLVAEGYIKARFKKRGRKGSVPTSEVFALIGREYPGPRLSRVARAQIAIESELAVLGQIGPEI